MRRRRLLLHPPSSGDAPKTACISRRSPTRTRSSSCSFRGNNGTINKLTGSKTRSRSVETTRDRSENIVVSEYR